MRAVAQDLSNLPLALKGGTALLFCYGLDRFSEDIDLDGSKKLNLENRLDAVLARVTSSHDIRIAKDTDTVQRFKIRYQTPKAVGNLKIEISYRTGFNEADVLLIGGMKTYRVDRLVEQKLRALDGRTAARDLYDVAFLAERYPESFTVESRDKTQQFLADLNTVESRFRPAFEADDLFADRANVDEVILRLQAAIDAPVRKDSRIETLAKAREQGRGHDNPDHDR